MGSDRLRWVKENPMKVYELFYLFYLAQALLFTNYADLVAAGCQQLPRFPAGAVVGRGFCRDFEWLGPRSFVVSRSSVVHGSEVNTHWPRSYMAAGAGMWALYFTWHPDLWMMVMDDWCGTGFWLRLMDVAQQKARVPLAKPTSFENMSLGVGSRLEGEFWVQNRLQ